MQVHGLRNFGNASFLKLADRPGIGVPERTRDKAVQEKRRRSRHANDVMGQELRCADAQPGPLWRQIADVFV
jgi:hypothetical protein